MKDDEKTLFVGWKSLKIPYTISKYKIQDKWILDISFSSTSPDVLYVLTRDGGIFSLRVSTLTLTKMTISGLQSSGHIWSLQCHNEFVYVYEFISDTLCAAVYKCIIEHSGSSLRVIGSCAWVHKGHSHVLSHMLDVRGGCLYLSTCIDVFIINSDTMTRLSTVSLQHRIAGIVVSLRHRIGGIAVSHDDKLHVATDNGVHVYTTDGTPTGHSYLDGERCVSVTCTSDGYSIVGMEGKVVVVSSDPLCIYHMYTSSTDTCVYHVMCDRVDNSLVIMDSIGSLFAIVPQEFYRPPFSLFLLCMSTILLNVNELPISLLPPGLHKLAKKYLMVHVHLHS